MFKLVSFTLAVITLCCGHAFSQNSPTNSAAPRFSSLYTDLKKDCRAAGESVDSGQVTPLRCKGYGGYSIYLSSSASTAAVYVDPTDGKSEKIESSFISVGSVSCQSGNRFDIIHKPVPLFISLIARDRCFQECEPSGLV